jgi:uncharacterized protein YeaO (DUF488 family)
VIKTKRWCDPAEQDDGFRVLIARYRPRGVTKAEETWSGFMPQLGPSKALHAAFYGKEGAAISLAEYEARYLREMAAQRFWIRGLAEHVRAGRNLTLLCSSACIDERRCHRSLLCGLVEAELSALAQAGEAEARAVVRRKK